LNCQCENNGNLKHLYTKTENQTVAHKIIANFVFRFFLLLVLYHTQSLRTKYYYHSVNVSDLIYRPLYQKQVKKIR